MAREVTMSGAVREMREAGWHAVVCGTGVFEFKSREK